MCVYGGGGGDVKYFHSWTVRFLKWSLSCTITACTWNSAPSGFPLTHRPSLTEPFFEWWPDQSLGSLDLSSNLGPLPFSSSQYLHLLMQRNSQTPFILLLFLVFALMLIFSNSNDSWRYFPKQGTSFPKKNLAPAVKEWFSPLGQSCLIVSQNPISFHKLKIRTPEF